MPNQLLRLAEENGIAVDWLDFETDFDALYICETWCPPVILISKNIKDRYHLRTILAHELGHHFTSAKSSVGQAYAHYKDRVETSRIEAKAWRWAANFLIPESKLKEVYSEDFCEAWQLAEFFEVDEELVRLRMKVKV